LHSRTVALDELETALRRLSAGPSDDIKVLVDPRWRSGSTPRPSTARPGVDLGEPGEGSNG